MQEQEKVRTRTKHTDQETMSGQTRSEQEDKCQKEKRVGQSKDK